MIVQNFHVKMLIWKHKQTNERKIIYARAANPAVLLLGLIGFTYNWYLVSVCVIYSMQAIVNPYKWSNEEESKIKNFQPKTC